MQVFVMRHGIADGHASSDFDRRLTPEGAAQFALGVQGLEQLGVTLDHVLHSPLLRAVETAELLEPLTRGPREVLNALADAPDERLFEALARTGERVALVGHEPWQSQTAAWLACGELRFGSALHLSKGAVVRLEGQPRPGAMHITGYWNSELLQALGRA